MPTKKQTDATASDGYESMEFLTELLEKLVDAQIAQSENTAQLRAHLEETSKRVEYIKSQFTNGFRSEMKNHIDLAASEINANLADVLKEVKIVRQKIDVFRRPWFWVKLIGAVFIGASSLIVAANTTYTAIYNRIEKQHETKKVVPTPGDAPAQGR
jgi:hypothetical protein